MRSVRDTVAADALVLTFGYRDLPWPNLQLLFLLEEHWLILTNGSTSWIVCTLGAWG